LFLIFNKKQVFKKSVFMLYYIMKILNDLYIPIVVLAVVAISYSAYLSMDIRSRSKTPINKKED